MKNEWKRVDEFVSHEIRCFIAKWEMGERPDKSWANYGEDGFYQYNGYCIVPSGYSLRGVIDEHEYAFLKTRLKNPSRIWNYKVGTPKDYNVHGGITYRDWGYGNSKQNHPITEWVIGFDTGHYGDSEGDFRSWGRGYKKGEDYVKYECKRLAKQIAEDVKKGYSTYQGILI